MNSFKVLLKILFIALLAYLFQRMFPWWSVVLASFLINFIISTKGLSSFIGGFLGIAILWFIQALIIDLRTDSILTDRIAQMFSLPTGILLTLITAFIGGIVGGFGGLTGYHLRSWVLPPG